MESIFDRDGIDDNERAILNFILENPGQTENIIGKFMNDKGLCAKETTRKKIRSLMHLSLIEDRKNKANGFHKFYASDKKQYNSIYGELLEIEKIMDAMHESVPKDLPSGSEEPYVETVSTILRFLLIMTIVTGMSDYDCSTLQPFITRLMVKLNNQHLSFSIPSGIDVLKRTRHDLDKLRKKLKSRPWSKENRRYSDSLENLVAHSENCEKTMRRALRLNRS